MWIGCGPETFGGRIISIGVDARRVGLVATVAASVAACFVGNDDGGETEELRSQLQRIEGTLDEISCRMGDRG